MRKSFFLLLPLLLLLLGINECDGTLTQTITVCVNPTVEETVEVKTYFYEENSNPTETDPTDLTAHLGTPTVVSLKPGVCQTFSGLSYLPSRKDDYDTGHTLNCGWAAAIVWDADGGSMSGRNADKLCELPYDCHVDIWVEPDRTFGACQ